MECKECGKKLGNQRKTQICNVCKAKLYYAHNEIRYDVWQFMKHHGKKVKTLYKLMCEEEGTEWVDKVLGEKLVEEIRAL